MAEIWKWLGRESGRVGYLSKHLEMVSVDLLVLWDTI